MTTDEPTKAFNLPAGYIWRSVTTDLVHPNWIRCDGRAVSRAAWPDLFRTIGTNFGPGDGESTFNVPNCAHEEGPAVSYWHEGGGPFKLVGPSYFFILGVDQRARGSGIDYVKVSVDL